MIFFGQVLIPQEGVPWCEVPPRCVTLYACLYTFISNRTYFKMPSAIFKHLYSPQFKKKLNQVIFYFYFAVLDNITII